MNCNTCRYELSQCLDGRLPSGRRQTVLAHAEACDPCGRFWEELQSAQRLALSLRPTSVSGDFRDGLWERVQAGEGTPDAVFHEPIPLATKVRYTLSGAAAAAALLIGVSLMQAEPSPPATADQVATAAPAPRAASSVADRAGARSVNTVGAETSLRPRSGAVDAGITSASLASTPLLSSAQPLTLQVLAREAAHQLEQRYHDATIGMRMMRDPAHNRAAAARRVIDNAHELRAFGELLIDLRDRKRLVFTDSELDRDLSFAVAWLERVPELTEGTPEAVDTYFGPALARPRLANVRENIGLTLTRDPQRELLELKELNSRQPEVFPKLFFVLSDIRDLKRELSAMQQRFAPIETTCGPSWVAPRSEVVRHGRLLRMFGAQDMGQQGQLRFEIEVREGR
jgi:hypothetical protein